MPTQEERIHQVVLDVGRPLSDLEIVNILRIGGETPKNTVRSRLNEAKRFRRGNDGRWAPPEWREPLAFVTARLVDDEFAVAHLVQPLSGMETYVAHQTIRNIVMSYEAAADPLAESVQNALDAARLDGRVAVSYDPRTGELIVDDDGAGMTREQFASLVSPNVSTKQTGDSVGYKGVGLTFLCFCSDDVEIAGDGWVATILHARQWVDDHFGWRWLRQPSVRFSVGAARSGIRYRTILSERVRQQLSWITSAKQLEFALRTHTPVGALAPIGPTKISLSVPGATDSPLNASRGPLLPTNFVTDRDCLNLARVEEKPQPMYEGAWRNWSAVELHDALSRRKGTSRVDNLSTIVKEHSIRVFGYIAKSREALTQIGDGPNSYELVGAQGVRVFARNQPLSRPPQPIRLTAQTGYASRLWIRIDVDGEADIGRKTLPAIEQQLQELASFIGKELVDKGLPWLYAEDPELRSRDDEEARRRSSHLWKIDERKVEYWAVSEEQDVVALYNRLTGTGLLGHLPIVASWGSTGVYDARARHLPDRVHPDLAALRPGVTTANDASLRIEFKMHAKDILMDVRSRKKSFENIDLLVAWDSGKWPETPEWYLETASGPVGERLYAGVTHLVRRVGSGEVVSRIILLSELLEPYSTS